MLCKLPLLIFLLWLKSKLEVYIQSLILVLNSANTCVCITVLVQGVCSLLSQWDCLHDLSCAYAEMSVGQGPKLSSVADEKHSHVITHSRNHGGGFFQGEWGNGNIYAKLPFLSLLQHDVQMNPKAIWNEISCLLLSTPRMVSVSLADDSRAHIHAATGSAAPVLAAPAHVPSLGWGTEPSLAQQCPTIAPITWWYSLGSCFSLCLLWQSSSTLRCCRSQAVHLVITTGTAALAQAQPMGQVVTG